MIPLNDFRHSTEIQIRWGDMDALGHVNNAVYLTYLEQARVQYMADLRMWDARVSKLGLIMARVVLDYKLPLLATDRMVTVFSRVSRLGSKSFDMAQIIARRVNDNYEAAASATITLVVFDYPANQSVPIPDEWRAAFAAYEPVAPSQ
jgi:acyl-CoA thioester hydrolase